MLENAPRKYEKFGEFLRERRKKRFRSAREFCVKGKLEISYPQYSRYEAGDQLPSLEQVLRMAALLEIKRLDALMEWNAAQVSEEEGREIRAELGKGPENGHPARAVSPSLKESVKVDSSIVFNRAHLRLFESDPAYRDVFTAINCANGWVRRDKIASALGLSEDKIGPMLAQLEDLGVISLSGSLCRTTKRSFYFPDDDDFFGLRNRNVMYDAGEILRRITPQDLTGKHAFRGVVTRDLGPDQLAQVIGRIEETMAEVLQMSDCPRAEKIYSVCALVGPRFPRMDMEQTE